MLHKMNLFMPVCVLILALAAPAQAVDLLGYWDFASSERGLTTFPGTVTIWSCQVLPLRSGPTTRLRKWTDRKCMVRWRVRRT